MNEILKAKLDEFIKNKRPNNRLRGHFVKVPCASDYYEEAKNVIFNTQLEYRIYLTCDEYEAAVKYVCKELGY